MDARRMTEALGALVNPALARNGMCVGRPVLASEGKLEVNENLHEVSALPNPRHRELLSKLRQPGSSPGSCQFPKRGGTSGLCRAGETNGGLPDRLGYYHFSLRTEFYASF